MNTNKTVPTNEGVADFLASLDSDEQRQDSEVLIGIMQEVTGKPPVMWGPSIVGFGSQHYKYNSGREGDVPEISFSPRKGKLSLYITYDVERYADHLAKVGPHKTGKACIYIKRLGDVDIDKLVGLIRQVYADETNRIAHVMGES